MSSTYEDLMYREDLKNKITALPTNLKTVCYREGYYKLVSTEVKSHFGIQRITDETSQSYLIVLMLIALVV